MIPATRLTLDDLRGLRKRFGGTLEQLADGSHVLRDTKIDGREITLGPVPGPVRVEVAS